VVVATRPHKISTMSELSVEVWALIGVGSVVLLALIAMAAVFVVRRVRRARREEEAADGKICKFFASSCWSFISLCFYLFYETIKQLL
jgi:TRAP-type C4-dicarboxylate transport system permease large subunit